MGTGAGAEGEDFIFFLVNKNEGPPSWFCPFALKFAAFQIKIVPITLSQILELSETHQRVHLMVRTTNFKSKSNLEKALGSVLGAAARQGKMVLYHISSFRENSQLSALRYKKIYSYYKIPIDMDFLCKDISRSYFRWKNEKQKEPDGAKCAGDPETGFQKPF